MSDNDQDHHTVGWAVAIVSSYVGNNSVPAAELPNLLGAVHAALSKIAGPPEETVKQPPVPAVSVRKSVADDHLVCLEDGKQFKSLKRHLQTVHGMTPDQYRERWNLGRDYPMVAPAYAKARSALAKGMGLGAGRRGTAAVAEDAELDTAELDDDVVDTSTDGVVSTEAAPPTQPDEPELPVVSEVPPAPKKRGRRKKDEA